MDVSIVPRARAILNREIQDGSQVAQRVEGDEGLQLEPHACARGSVEHPDRDMDAVASLVAGHMAAQHVRARAALLAFDQDVLSEEWMPRVRYSPPLRALRFVCGDSSITPESMRRPARCRASTG